jgi:hypothetical protein
VATGVSILVGPCGRSECLVDPPLARRPSGVLGLGLIGMTSLVLVFATMDYELERRGPHNHYDGVVLSYWFSSIPGAEHEPLLAELAQRGVRWIAIHDFMAGTWTLGGCMVASTR